MFRVLILILFSAMHPVHVTLFSLEYTETGRSFNGFLMVYYDDFKLDFISEFGSEPSEFGIADSIKVKGELERYVEAKLKIRSDRKLLDPEVFGYSLSDNELRMRLKYESDRRIKKLLVSNNILTGIYADQSNFVIVKHGEFEKGVKLTEKTNEHLFTIK